MLNTAKGEVFGLCRQKHRRQQWLRFLRMIDQTVPPGKQIYLIRDSYGTHKHETVKRWLEKHLRFQVLFTPPRLHGSTWWSVSFATSRITISGAESSRIWNS
jgi:hypothetical protein